jgi:hypothetical protein
MDSEDSHEGKPGAAVPGGAPAATAFSSFRIAREESLRILHANLTPDGIRAASPSPEAEDRNYTRIFGRDAAVCALGMAVSGDGRLRAGAAASLVSLARFQADNGQIPNFVDPSGGDADFWYLGCIDATLWWLIALRFLSERDPEGRLEDRLRGPADRALAWLRCQEHPGLFLLRQNEASDWADIMPRSGFVLYTNALWYRVKRLYGLGGAEETKRFFNALFSPYRDGPPGDRRLRFLKDGVPTRSEADGLYLSFVSLAARGTEGDVFGNILAVLFGLPDPEGAERILRGLQAAEVDRPFPVRAVCAPISREDPLWRPYMERHGQNLEHQYHNGGAWPFLGGFWVVMLAALGRARGAGEAFESLAGMNRMNGWGFNEWFHGVTGEPRGMRGQSWNAAMLLLAQRALDEKLF